MGKKKDRSVATEETPDESSGLGVVPCLAALSAATRSRLQEEAPETAYRRGDLLFQQGDPGEDILILTKGNAKLYRVFGDGRQQTVKILGPGDCYCVAPAFNQGRYPVSAQCLTPVRAVRLAREQWQIMLQENTEWAGQVIKCLCQRTAELAALLDTASPRQVRRRLARFLLGLAKGRGISPAASSVVEAELTHDELAGCVGTAREVISRTLEQFQREGLVRLGRGRLLLLDLPRLESLLTPPRSAKKKPR